MEQCVSDCVLDAGCGAYEAGIPLGICPKAKARFWSFRATLSLRTFGKQFSKGQVLPLCPQRMTAQSNRRAAATVFSSLCLATRLLLQTRGAYGLNHASTATFPFWNSIRAIHPSWSSETCLRMNRHVLRIFSILWKD